MMQPGEGILLPGVDGTTVRLDFMKDLANVFRHELGQLGCKINLNSDLQELGIMFFNTLSRRIEARPRQIHVSRELRAKIARSAGLSKDDKVGLRRLKEKIDSGRDVQPHLSTLTARADKKDGLLYDWGIYHLHLGIGPHPRTRGFVARTPQVLLALIHPDNAYLLDALDHRELDAVMWAPKELLEIILANWPMLLDRGCRMHGFVGLVNEPTSLQHGQLRAAGAMSFVQLSNGGIYGPPGGGIQTSRDSTLSVMAFDRCAIKVKQWEQWVRGNARQKADLARQAGLPVGRNLEFELYVENSTAYARECDSGLRFALGNLP